MLASIRVVGREREPNRHLAICDGFIDSVKHRSEGCEILRPMSVREPFLCVKNCKLTWLASTGHGRECSSAAFRAHAVSNDQKNHMYSPRNQSSYSLVLKKLCWGSCAPWPHCTTRLIPIYSNSVSWSPISLSKSWSSPINLSMWSHNNTTYSSSPRGLQNLLVCELQLGMAGYLVARERTALLSEHIAYSLGTHEWEIMSIVRETSLAVEEVVFGFLCSLTRYQVTHV